MRRSLPEGIRQRFQPARTPRRGWARRLNEHGIYHYRQVAELTQENLEELDEAFNAKGKIAQSGWIEQAKQLMGENASEPVA